MKLFKLSPFALLFMGIVIAGCSEEEELTIPAPYDSTNYVSNTTDVSGQIKNFRDIVSELKKGDGDNNGTITASDCDALLMSGSPNVYDLTSAYYRTKLSGWFAEAEAASNATSPFDFNAVPSPNGVGGVAGAHLLDEHGVELEQLVDKGLYTAFTFHYGANTFLSGEVSLTDLDNALALFGAPPTFPNDGGPEDKISAIYVSRRDAAGGFYKEIQKNFIKAKAAIQQEFPNERDAAVKAIVENWEKGLAATIVNYLYGTVSKINLGTSEGYANAMHDWSEAVGFLYGFYQVPNTIITDAEVSDILTLINFPINGTPTPVALTQSATELADVQQAIDQLASIYGFNDPSLFK